MAYEQEFDLGMVTAYAYAVSKGYDGTEEEFAELMASYAEVAEDAAASAAAAAGSATDAAGSASTATTKANAASASANDAAGSATTASAKADEASASATSAAGNASVASGKAGEAAASATAAAGSATTASTKASEASTSATNAATAKTAAEAAQSAAETAQGKAEDAQEAAEAAAEQAEATLSSYAKVDGSYSSMTVGNAEQLVATVAVEDSVPYNFRTSGGTADIGDREVDKLVGGTIAWNQLADGNATSGNHFAESWASTLSADNGTIVFTTTRDSAQIGFNYVNKDVLLRSDHKYLVGIEIKSCSSTPTSVQLTLGDNWTSLGSKDIDYSGAKLYARIISANGNGTSGEIQRLMVRLYYSSGAVIGDNATVYGGIWVDLTQMFGSTIADYIYSLETATPGAGVAWFRKLFPKPYYAYNPGELMSVQAAAHKMVGFNAWDEEWELGGIISGNNAVYNERIRSKNRIAILPNTQYYLATSNRYSGNVWAAYYTADGAYIAGGNTNGTTALTKNAVFTTPKNAYFMRFQVISATTYANDICINLSWDGERDGEYEPYAEHSYPLDDALTLRGIPKLDSGNALYYDGDTYESDGTVTRRYGVVDLGTLTWSYTSGDNSRFVATKYHVKRVSSTSDVANIVCTRYVAASVSSIYTHTNDKTIGIHNTNEQIWIYDSAYSDVETFTASLSGQYLVYELDTPTTETADPYQSPQIVDDFGTEEYVDAAVAAETRDVAIPVGHDTLYQANLRAKLEMAPDSPDGDGDYIVRQTNGTNAYVPLMKELPTAPTTEGTYHLKATVASGGAVTLTWEADT